MHPVIHFYSRRFDVSLEPENPFNPIRGVSVLQWLAQVLPRDLALTPPEPEDWGWYSQAIWNGRQYLIGACAHESPDGNHAWVLQIEKSRSILERLLDRERLTANDTLVSLIMDTVLQERSLEQGMLEISAEWKPNQRQRTGQ